MLIKTVSKEYVNELLLSDKRIDGRGLLDFRKLSIKTGIMPHAEGSALVELGNTRVIAGVKIDIGEPLRDKPDEGALMTGAELLPMASPKYEAGPPSPESVEFARVVDRGIRSAELVDMQSLFIEKEKVWMVFIDMYVMNADGNLFDAGSLASVAALLSARMPKLEGEEIIRTGNLHKLKTNGIVTSCTFGKIGDKLLLDTNGNEEEYASTRLTVANDEKYIRAMQKGLSGDMSIKEIQEMIDISADKSKELRSAIKRAVEE